MRNFSAAFTAHLQNECTTLCWLWKLCRRDMTVIGFTDHDRDIVVDNITYQAASGFSPTDMDGRLGFSLDNSAVQGLLSSDLITDTDIHAGLYDGAAIEIRRANWQNPAQNGLVWGGKIGDITIKDGQFEAELVGHGALLERSTGRVYARQCDASFGDERCMLDPANYPAGTDCPRTWDACQNQFSNTKNFRGFPYLIGEDAVFSAPKASDKKDGSSRYS